MLAVLHTCVSIYMFILFLSFVVRAPLQFQSRKLVRELGCRIPAWIPAKLSGTCVSVYESIVRHRYVVRAFRTLQSQSRKLVGELEPWMLAASNCVHRLFTFCKRTRFSIDQSLVVRRVLRIILCQFRKLTVLVPIRMRELACKFLDSWLLQAENYVHGLREELSCSDRTRTSIDQYVVLRSL